MKLWNINSIIKMKTHINYTRKNRLAKRLNASGMTLIEISLVIALLLGLIAVVFMGLGTYRQGADKAKCKMQLSAVQKAVRSGAWKYLSIEGNEFLFDLTRDERERANRRHREPERFKALRAAFIEWEARMPLVPEDARYHLVYRDDTMARSSG